MGRPLNIYTAMAVSLLFHLTVYGAIAVFNSGPRHSAEKEYIPVNLVQFSAPRRTSQAASRLRTAHPEKHATAPVADSKPLRPEPEVKPHISPVPKVGASAPTPRPESLSPQPASAPETSGAQETERNPASELTSPVMPGDDLGGAASASWDKKSYRAFHRLTGLPSFRVRIEPVYPDAERLSGKEARVLAEIYIAADGTVDRVIIKKSAGRLFDEAVKTAALQSRFHPGYLGEAPTPTVIQIPYTFKLK